VTGPTIRWVEVASFARQEEARLLAGRLESEGIRAEVYPPQSAEYYGPGTSAFLGQPFQVLVPEHLLVEAQAVLDALERA
jgi:hypothetical protein